MLMIKRAGRGRELGIVYGGIVLLALAAARLLPVLDLAPSCVFRSLTGLPCPTCGSTRSFVFLSQGRLLAAFSMNPLIVLAALFAVLYLAFSLAALAFDLPGMSFSLADGEKDRVRAAAVLLVLVNWLYLLFSA